MAPGRSRSSPEAACKLPPPTARPGHDHRHVRAIALCRLHGVDAAVRRQRHAGAERVARLEAVRRGGLAQGVARRLGGRNAVRAVSPAIANRQHRRRMAGHGADRYAGQRGAADPLWTGLDPAGGGDAAGAVPVSAAPAGLDMAARARLGPGPAAAGAERARRDGGGQDRPAPRAERHAALPGGRFLAGVAAGLPADPAAMDGARLSRRCHPP